MHGADRASRRSTFHGTDYRAVCAIPTREWGGEGARWKRERDKEEVRGGRGRQERSGGVGAVAAPCFSSPCRLVVEMPQSPASTLWPAMPTGYMVEGCGTMSTIMRLMHSHRFANPCAGLPAFLQHSAFAGMDAHATDTDADLTGSAADYSQRNSRAASMLGPGVCGRCDCGGGGHEVQNIRYFHGHTRRSFSALPEMQSLHHR